MIIHEKRTFLLGAVMAVSFFVVLFLMFLPLFGGRNAFETSDRLFNSIAKGSSDYFKDLRERTERVRGSEVAFALQFKTADMALKANDLLFKAGMHSEIAGVQVTASGDLGRLAAAVLDDSETMFHDRGEEIEARYGYPGKEVLFVWWSTLKEIRKALESRKEFEAAAFVDNVTRRGVEVAYNFYGIEPKNASAAIGVLGGALLFYIVYTLWWGYAILYLFDGFGLKMRAGAKKEV
jgi:hypothetical protein